MVRVPEDDAVPIMDLTVQESLRVEFGRIHRNLFKMCDFLMSSDSNAR
jgi:hypothetical protein